VPDLYETLGVSKTATADEIRKAYRALARKHHPDANPDDPKAEERFKEISHAHDVLSDSEKRKEYDAQASMFSQGFRPGGGGTAGGDGGFGGFGDFADLFGSIFRNRGNAGGPGGAAGAPPRSPGVRGADVEVEVNISFDQAMAGLQLPISVDKRETCATCRGSGAKAGTSPRLCPECNGRGVVGRDLGSFALSEPCPRCGGNGTVVDEPCPTCGGAGSVDARKRYNVKIPAGAKDGTKIRLRGKGEAGVGGGPAGDLIVITRVAPSPRYTRRGDDLELEVPVTFAEAAMGAKVEIPTLEGPVSLSVPPGSQTGRRLRVRGKGAPRLKGEGRGDLIARLRVDVPRDLTNPQREALERFAELAPGNPRETLFR
jgi:molecular chaperone DnaJ